MPLTGKEYEAATEQLANFIAELRDAAAGWVSDPAKLQDLASRAANELVRQNLRAEDAEREVFRLRESLTALLTEAERLNREVNNLREREGWDKEDEDPSLAQARKALGRD